MTKEEQQIMQKIMDILSVYREDHVCTDEDCEECEWLLTAEEFIEGGE